MNNPAVVYVMLQVRPGRGASMTEAVLVDTDPAFVEDQAELWGQQHPDFEIEVVAYIPQESV